ncbi:hypothetical protein PCH_Pc13g13520 [Penicillium rubens Wisconsin 54-1255]|uniref:Uncharacterized protein n=1 Tax=Penicillium rubens (strain ATCC 28089 / DSM 1075 / NRRL 1951 / Wisconsin 54-1255) TaxID=500485 RepID=B6H3M2_PENRW|nr:hypothetical protein PCH_Pc13g13520 [Penicillium rubens Wisconsin 54-1255]
MERITYLLKYPLAVAIALHQAGLTVSKSPKVVVVEVPRSRMYSKDPERPRKERPLLSAPYSIIGALPERDVVLENPRMTWVVERMIKHINMRGRRAWEAEIGVEGIEEKQTG